MSNSLSGEYEIEFEEADIPAAADEPPQDQQKLQNLTKLLRYLGALVLFSSAIAFVLQGWSEWDSLLRYYVFLGFTAILSAAGMFCGVKLSDDKGARTFLGVAVAIIPAHLTQLAALLYSRFLDAPANVPQMFLYQAPSTFAALMTIAIAAVFLLPIAFAGFSAMARSEAFHLTKYYLIANTMLLIPSRQPGFIALLAAVTIAVTYLVDFRAFHGRTVAQTWEGRAARAMLFVPGILLLLRNILLYGATELLLAAAASGGALLFFSVLPRLYQSRAARQVFESIGLLCVAFAWLLFVQGVFYDVHGLLYDVLERTRVRAFLPLHFLPIAAIFGVLSFRSKLIGSGCRNIAAGIAISTSFAQLFVGGDVISSFLCIMVAIITIVGAFVMEERGLFFTGCAGLAAGLLYHIRYALDLYSMSPWMTLAVTGILVVLASSYIERYYRSVLLRFRSLRSHIDSWE